MDATLPRTRWYNLIYPALVWSALFAYLYFAVVPFFAQGIHQFSYTEISNQVGVPGYGGNDMAYGLAIASAALLPWLNLLPAMFTVYTFPLDQAAYSRFEQRALKWALATHAAMLLWMLTYGQAILIWLYD